MIGVCFEGDFYHTRNFAWQCNDYFCK